MVDIFSNKLKSFMTKLKNYIYLEYYGLVHGYSTVHYIISFYRDEISYKKKWKKILYFSNINLVGVHEYRPTTKFNEILH